MSKRFIVATFANGHKLTRTTTNSDLAWAWKATYIRKDGSVGGSTGFSGRRDLAEKAANGYGKYGSNLVAEIVATVEEAKPVKPSTKGLPWRIIESTTYNNGSRFVRGEKRAYLRYATRAEADKVAEAMTAESFARHKGNSNYVACSYQPHKGKL